MQVFVAVVVLIGVAWTAFWILRGIWRFLGAIGYKPEARRRGPSAGMSADEEGNLHSGPYGYSPNTAYPQTQYGSLFDPDAEWNHEEQ